ncbi:hypothetical protein DERP_010324 [Dermatophagoides pteronyssinus]|uniref:Fork-head domain-containing protein n=1 Tax=Dermatophagoides pteronyssinus TaxID=6956 RepID=A0ABQ8IYT2_DERPT|nr:hypothetical protein DERP_010324 [Dermatophagoides pteronyssinus]
MDLIKNNVNSSTDMINDHHPHNHNHHLSSSPSSNIIDQQQLIYMNHLLALSNSSDIYQYILDNYSYFRNRGPGWRNSIRHNLSLNDCFMKAGRSANGKGHYWAIHPANLEDFKKGDFRRRKAQRKVRRHMGLSVPDDDDDDDDDDDEDDVVVNGRPILSSPISLVTNRKPSIAATASINRPFTYHHHSIPTLPPPTLPPSTIRPTTQPLLSSSNPIVPTNAAAFFATQQAINFFQTLTNRFAMNQQSTSSS